MTKLKNSRKQVLSRSLHAVFNGFRLLPSREKVSAKDRVPRSCHREIMRGGRFLLASLCLATAIGCGSTSAPPKLGSPPSGPPVGSPAPAPTVETCNETGHILPGGNATAPIDLQINGTNCIVDGTGNAGDVSGSYAYRNVNIWNGGTLTFNDKPIDFHAHSILVEMGGTLQAGTTSPINGPLTIWLWGAKGDGIPSITCQSDTIMPSHCGVSDTDWGSNPSMANMQMPTKPCTPATQLNLPNQPGTTTKDCFYQYEQLELSDPPNSGTYFGSKVLAVSAGGSLTLRGAKGIRMGTGPTPEAIEDKPADSGTSWARLTTTLTGGETAFSIDRAVPTWAAGDHVVVTTTDYLPGHTEELVIKSVMNNGNSATITIDPSAPAPMNAVHNHHYGETYPYGNLAAENPANPPGPVQDMAVTNLPPQNIETRAIVALLTRSIVIASEGATPTFTRGVDHFPVAQGTPANYYGGHTLARQGFTAFELQGVEFYQLGQGGLIGHYPVHFHMDRSVPQPNGDFLGTYVADSSIVDSMTRFITVHATQGVTLARNVGYKSIGHGFYLEDATETNNRLYSNAGITVRGALADTDTNPRMVPGILDLPVSQINALPAAPLTPIGGQPANVNGQIPDIPPYVTDVTTPSVFWIMNNWNDFEYNAAVGAEACGACYWMVPGGYSFKGVQNGQEVGLLQGGPSKYETWTSYAGMEKQGLKSGLLGGAPLMTFKGNSCTAAMNSISTVGQTSPCNGIFFGPGSSENQLYSVPNPNSVTYDSYPAENLARAKATLCDSAHPPNTSGDCSTAPPCSGVGGQEGTCAATVIDHYTTSFNWAQTNLAAIWLRGWWYLLDNSAITDVQNGGLTFISGGGYTRSDAAQGFWSVLKDSILVGNTQPNTSDGVPANPYASNAGPFNPYGQLKCTYNGSYCLSATDGVSFQLSNFGGNQRLFNIYDGPASQYNNIYTDVTPTTLGTLENCRAADGNAQPGNCVSLNWGNGYQVGVILSPPGKPMSKPTDNLNNKCVLPNAAIAWKQPNGFYYPPAFNSDNLVFNNVDIRHFVIQPLPDPFDPSGNNSEIQNTYCTWNPGMFATSFTDIDRQTELTDNDATLTGLISKNTQQTPSSGPTISVTKDPFFNAPMVTDQCASGQLPPATPIESGSLSGATASTSPYEYLTTAIVARCAINNSCGVPPPPNPAPAPFPTTYWDTQCSTPQCYGVPLYRQIVTQPELNNINTSRPSIKMMGQASAQRSTLTVNHGQYYIDTTVPINSQWHTGPTQFQVMFMNAFQPSQVYDVFLLFAKNSTKQTYSLYIGTGLTQAQAQAAIVPARVMIPGNNFPMQEYEGSSWATFGSYNSTTGLLTVNVDLSGLKDLAPSEQSTFCQPTSFCSWNTQTSSCGCNPAAGSGCTPGVDDQVCSYATKDIDCPADGCYGFNIHMPDSFVAAKQPNLPPMPILFQNADPYFGNVSFETADKSIAGSCFYSTPPTSQLSVQQGEAQTRP